MKHLTIKHNMTFDGRRGRDRKVNSIQHNWANCYPQTSISFEWVYQTFNLFYKTGFKLV